MAESIQLKCLIPNEHLVKICKFRQKDCCRYIVYFKDHLDFFCVKNTELKNQIDSMVNNMNAKGDNCGGL